MWLHHLNLLKNLCWVSASLSLTNKTFPHLLWACFSNLATVKLVPLSPLWVPAHALPLYTLCFCTPGAFARPVPLHVLSYPESNPPSPSSNGSFLPLPSSKPLLSFRMTSSCQVLGKAWLTWQSQLFSPGWPRDTYLCHVSATLHCFFVVVCLFFSLN